MTRSIDRRLLQEALQQGQQITQRAASGQGFDPRGGPAVALAQIATAGIGTFAQNRARKQLAEIEEQDKARFEANFPQFAGMNLSPETREAARQTIVRQELEGPKAPEVPKRQIIQTERGFFAADPQSGLAIPVTTTPREDRLTGGLTGDGEVVGGEQLRPRASRPLVEVKTGELEKQEQKELGKIFAKKFETITQAGDQARRGVETLETLKMAVEDPNASQGVFAGVRADAKKFADLFGVKVEGIENDAIITSLGNKLALQLRNPKGEDGGLTGATSDRDLKFLLAGVPGRDKTREQNLALIEIGIKDKERTLRLQQLANEFLEEQGTFKGFAKVKRQFFEENPLFEEGSEEKERVKGLLKGDIKLPNQTQTPTASTQGFKVLNIRDK